MRILSPLRSSTAFLFLLASSYPLLSQSAGGSGMGTGTGVVIGALGPGSVAGVPYTVTRKTTHVQTLANGTTITRVTTVKEARDSYGKTYRESRPGDQGAMRGLVMYSVNDPTNRVIITWNSTSRQAFIIHLPEPMRLPPAQVPRTSSPAMSPSADVPDSLPMFAARPQTEKLGTQTISGVIANGTRITRTIPAGRVGNDQPLTVTTESWFSSDLKMNVLQIQDDPRSGKTTTELTDIDLNEPDPTLFQVPEGYTVQERNSGEPQLLTPPPPAPR